MSEDYKRVIGDIEKLYESRKDHEGRIMVLESTIHEIRKDQAEIKQDIRMFHDQSMDDVRLIQGSINKFIQEINGIPKQNSEAIVAISKDVKSNRDFTIKWGTIVSVLMAVMTLVSIAVGIYVNLKK